MKAEKIEIIKTLIDVPIGQQHYVERIFPGLNMVVPEGQIPVMADMNFEENIYELKQVANGYPNKINTRNYFVKIDDSKVFNDLMVIGEADIRKNFKNGEKIGKQLMLVEYKNFLKRPWYKRLFVKNILSEVVEELNDLRYSLRE